MFTTWAVLFQTAPDACLFRSWIWNYLERKEVWEDICRWLWQYLGSCFFSFTIPVHHLEILLICSDSDFTNVTDCKYHHHTLFLRMLMSFSVWPWSPSLWGDKLFVSSTSIFGVLWCALTNRKGWRSCLVMTCLGHFLFCNFIIIVY